MTCTNPNKKYRKGPVGQPCSIPWFVNNSSFIDLFTTIQGFVAAITR